MRNTTGPFIWWPERKAEMSACRDCGAINGECSDNCVYEQLANEQARNRRYRILLEHGLNQMQKINGGNEKCVIGHPTNCPNHAWIQDVQEALDLTAGEEKP